MSVRVRNSPAPEAPGRVVISTMEQMVPLAPYRVNSPRALFLNYFQKSSKINALMGAKNRYAARIDDNQRAIVRELRQIPGVQVLSIGQPVDLLVGYQARNYLFEVKRPDKAHRPSAQTESQKRFIPNWTGQVRIVSTTDEILETIQTSYQSA